MVCFSPTNHPSSLHSKEAVAITPIILSLFFYCLSLLSAVGITHSYVPVIRLHGFVLIEMKRRHSRVDSPASTIVVTETSISTHNETTRASPPSKIRRQGSKLLSVYKSLTGRGYGMSLEAIGALHEHHAARHGALEWLLHRTLLKLTQKYFHHKQPTENLGIHSVKNLHQVYPDPTFFCAEWRLFLFGHRPSPPLCGDLSPKEDLQYSPRRHLPGSLLHHQWVGTLYHYLKVMCAHPAPPLNRVLHPASTP